MRGKVVLITGASSGIGAGTAVHFAAKGCLLALTGRSKTGLRDTFQACLRAGAEESNVLLIEADLQVFENLAMIVEKTVAKFGKLDVLVNNAGSYTLGKIADVTLEQYDEIMGVNLKSVFFLTQAALPHLLESKGNIVNVSSIWSRIPAQFSFPYNMSKAAQDHFTRTLALDVAAKGVRVNAISPGPVKTSRTVENHGGSFDYDEVVKRKTAMRRAGTVEEMAKTIAFLADDKQSSFTTGVNFVVDGGATLLGPI